MEALGLAGIGALAAKVLDVFKFAQASNWNGVTTQLAAWVSGVVAVLLGAQTDFAAGMQLGEFSLAELNFASQVFVGLLATSVLSITLDFRKALDNTDSAAMPSLTRLPGSELAAIENAPARRTTTESKPKPKPRKKAAGR